jgi:hypothetical protein
LLLVTAGMLSKRPADSNDPGGIPAKFLGAMQRTQRCVIGRRSPAAVIFRGFSANIGMTFTLTHGFWPAITPI